DEIRTDTLGLLQNQSLHRNFKQSCLYIFPTPTFLFFCIMKLNFLHSVDQLHYFALFLTYFRESLIIQCFPTFKKNQYPTKIQETSNKKNSKYLQIIICQNSSHDEHVHKRKQNI